MIGALDISGSALVAQRTRLDVIAANMANAFTTRQEDGRIEPYRRRMVSFASGDGRGGPGVHVDALLLDDRPFELRYEPGHPDAGPDGYVRYPNVSLTQEYVDALEASRAYEFNVAVMEVTKAMLRRAINLWA